jgi:adenylate kinase family enzyme
MHHSLPKRRRWGFNSETVQSTRTAPNGAMRVAERSRFAQSRRSTALDFFFKVRLTEEYFLSAMYGIDPSALVGSRIVVTGMAGAGKSTFSRLLSKKTGLPVISLDLHRWNPGWVRLPVVEFLKKQRILLAGDRWIVDSNDVDDDLLLQRADTLLVLATPWWICSLRAFKRGLRRPRDIQLPDGCEESLSQRLRDEWGIVLRNWRDRKSVSELELSLASRCRGRLKVHVLKSKQEMIAFAESV